MSKAGKGRTQWHLAAALAVAAAMFAAPAIASENEDILAAAKTIFEPYRNIDEPMGAAWNMPVYSHEMSALVSEWEEGLSDDEPEDLNDFDWFCQCQDFNPEKFRADFGLEHEDGAPTAIVEIRVNIGWDEQSTAQSKLLMKQEGGEWKLDDVASESFEGGLKAQLRKAIEAHKAN